MDKKIKTVILEADTVTHGELPLTAFTELGDTEIYGITPNCDVIKNIGDADAVICNKCLITDKVFESCKNLKYVGILATGYNNVDISSAKRHGVTVCNVPSYSTNSVAQHTFAFILHFFNSAAVYDKTVKNGDWIKSPTFSYFNIPTAELCGKTIGIVGYGSIGKRVADIARAFGMSVITYTRSPLKVTDGTECVALEELLKRADIVTLHCPLTEDNARLINADTLRLMKPTAFVINTARGALIDENALANALNGSAIAGACLDVLDSEPMRADCPLINAKNCVITPHIAWAPVQTRARLIEKAANNLKAWLDGKPQNSVN